MQPEVENLADDSPHEECGVFGIYGHPEATNITFSGLFALQHRGQESAGIATSDGAEIRSYKRTVLASEVFD